MFICQLTSSCHQYVMVVASGEGLKALLCMKANEVMKDDILLDGSNNIVVVTSAGETTNMQQDYIRARRIDELPELYDPSELRPLPLSDEVIRGSNIPAHCTGVGCECSPGKYSLYVNGMRVELKKITPTDWRLSVFSDLPLSNYDCYFQNMHQLQHAMTDQGVQLEVRMFIRSIEPNTEPKISENG